MSQYDCFKDDLSKVKDQLIRLFNSHNYVFPHIHPHWRDSIFLSDMQQFDLSELRHYSLSSLTLDEIEREFNESITYLKEIGINYSQWGYRAGGWSIQPFANCKPSFIKHHIAWDFSVLSGYKSEAAYHKFDYLAVNNFPYFFSEHIELENKHGEFVEFPISSLQLRTGAKTISRLIQKWQWKTDDRGYGDGISAVTADLKSSHQNKEMVSIDSFNLAKVNSYKKFVHHNNYMHWISHPKMFTRHSLTQFSQFIKYINKNHLVNYDFKLIDVIR